ncbi:hypothetical protein BAOM_1118 [Peribacillus asahii]|uniref:Thiamine phosphate synthase n=1 Tax=Peribacillus asahii TaxID=228899 RepID=A0A3T0KMV1_9BACI|nr:hypothetical protein [Peribacillus asahii]AZV41729.1 hypothetical protein BAOM_1118 [Peribacillus asahii]
MAGKSNMNKVSFVPSLKWAVAGGITIDSIKHLMESRPHIVIIGLAITKADHPEKIAAAFREIIG